MLRQKYIGEVKHYEVDDYFVDKIRDLPTKVGFDIAKQIDRAASDLPELDFWEQQVAVGFLIDYNNDRTTNTKEKN